MMGLMVGLAAALALAISPLAKADELYLTLHGKANHYATGDKYVSTYNDDVYGAGITLRDVGAAGHAGAYRNSYNRLSTYLGYSWEYCYRAKFCGGPIAFVATGYPQAVVVPMLGVVVGVGLSELIRLNAVITPSVTEFNTEIRLR